MAAPQGGGGRSNVSVTSINCDTNGEYPYSAAAATNLLNGVRIAVPNLEDVSDSSDTELSKIDFAHQVTLRSKKPQQTQDGPRPMSWEGGLSDGEEEQMDTVDTQRTDGQEVTPKVESPSRAEDVKPPEFTNIYGKMMGGTSEGAAPVDAHRGVACEMNLKYEPQDGSATPNGITNLFNGSIDHPLRSLHKGHNNIIPDLLGSPLLARQHKSTIIPTNPSPDSAIHSVYTHSSPSQSPLTARHAPYTPNLSRNNSDASHSSCYSYSSEFSPAHSPIQGRHMASMLHSSPLHHSVLIRPLSVDEAGTNTVLEGTIGEGEGPDEERPPHALAGAAGISRQQLINSPCPICGDKISGFHYGIFSCESCKGFFKRTVQNRKNYVCLRGASCPVSIATRKKCPACRFDKCLQRGMKLEAIREDRTRGGRSTYQCSYTLPQGTLLCPGSPLTGAESPAVRAAPSPLAANHSVLGNKSLKPEPGVPPLLQEIMDVEHLWQYNDSEMNRLSRGSNHVPGSAQPSVSLATNPLLASAGLAHSEDSNPDFLANLCNIADHRLYKIVKWCKSLPLFKNISIDDQICLLINSWCELLLFSCCYRSMGSPGEIRVSLGKSISLEQARHSGLQACIERMLNLTEHLRRLRIDRYEYVAMKVIVLLTSDTSELREPEKVRASQEKALQALQGYTLSHYPHSPAKFGELLLRIPELQRTCQVGKEMLTIKSKEGEGPSFNLLMELLRGEH